MDPPVPPPLYGLDIETDTAAGGLDPRLSRIIAVAVAAPDRDIVLTGAEPGLLADLDQLVSGLASGVLVTWNGASFDLPYLADRARRCGTRLALTLALDPSLPTRTPLPGHEGSYRGVWYGHRHLDAYRVYRNDLKRFLDVSCSLKSVAQLLGLPTTAVDAARVHELTNDELVAYVASDARLAQAAAMARWPTAAPFVDPDPDRHPDPAPRDRKPRSVRHQLLPSTP